MALHWRARRLPGCRVGVCPRHGGYSPGARAAPSDVDSEVHDFRGDQALLRPEPTWLASITNNTGGEVLVTVDAACANADSVIASSSKNRRLRR
jgi:hypothetical protein